MKNAVVSSMLFAAIALAGCNKDQQQANGEGRYFKVQCSLVYNKQDWNDQ